MKFTIIVPIYNAAKYINRCVNCVLSQTYRNWELILINDGSTDDSWELIKKYADQDNRIVALSQKNQGPGAARNYGLSIMTGDYVVFYDCDDIIEFDYLELLEPLAKKHDLVFIDVMQITPEGRKIKEQKMSSFSKWTRERIIRAMMTGMIPWGGVRKTVSSRIIKNNNIKYANIQVGEESLFSFQSLYFSKTYGFLSKKIVYKYEIHEISQSTLRIDDPWGATFEVLRAYINEIDQYRKYVDTLNSFNIVSTLASVSSIFKYYPIFEGYSKVTERIKTFEKRHDNDFKVDFDSVDYRSIICYPLLKMKMVFLLFIISKLRDLFKKAKI